MLEELILLRAMEDWVLRLAVLVETQFLRAVLVERTVHSLLAAAGQVARLRALSVVPEPHAPVPENAVMVAVVAAPTLAQVTRVMVDRAALPVAVAAVAAVQTRAPEA